MSVDWNSALKEGNVTPPQGGGVDWGSALGQPAPSPTAAPVTGPTRFPEPPSGEPGRPIFGLPQNINLPIVGNINPTDIPLAGFFLNQRTWQPATPEEVSQYKPLQPETYNPLAPLGIQAPIQSTTPVIGGIAQAIGEAQKPTTPEDFSAGIRDLPVIGEASRVGEAALNLLNQSWKTIAEPAAGLLSIPLRGVAGALPFGGYEKAGQEAGATLQRAEERAGMKLSEGPGAWQEIGRAALAETPAGYKMIAPMFFDPLTYAGGWFSKAEEAKLVARTNVPLERIAEMNPLERILSVGYIRSPVTKDAVERANTLVEGAGGAPNMGLLTLKDLGMAPHTLLQNILPWVYTNKAHVMEVMENGVSGLLARAQFTDTAKTYELLEAIKAAAAGNTLQPIANAFPDMVNAFRSLEGQRLIRSLADLDLSAVKAVRESQLPAMLSGMRALGTNLKDADSVWKAGIEAMKGQGIEGLPKKMPAWATQVLEGVQKGTISVEAGGGLEKVLNDAAKYSMVAEATKSMGDLIPKVFELAPDERLLAKIRDTVKTLEANMFIGLSPATVVNNWGNNVVMQILHGIDPRGANANARAMWSAWKMNPGAEFFKIEEAALGQLARNTRGVGFAGTLKGKPFGLLKLYSKTENSARANIMMKGVEDYFSGATKLLADQMPDYVANSIRAVDPSGYLLDLVKGAIRNSFSPEDILRFIDGQIPVTLEANFGVLATSLGIPEETLMSFVNQSGEWQNIQDALISSKSAAEFEPKAVEILNRLKSKIEAAQKEFFDPNAPTQYIKEVTIRSIDDLKAQLVPFDKNFVVDDKMIRSWIRVNHPGVSEAGVTKILKDTYHGAPEGVTERMVSSIAKSRGLEKQAADAMVEFYQLRANAAYWALRDPSISASRANYYQGNLRKSDALMRIYSGNKFGLNLDQVEHGPVYAELKRGGQYGTESKYLDYYTQRAKGNLPGGGPAGAAEVPPGANVAGAAVHPTGGAEIPPTSAPGGAVGGAGAPAAGELTPAAQQWKAKLSGAYYGDLSAYANSTNTDVSAAAKAILAERGASPTAAEGPFFQRELSNLPEWMQTNINNVARALPKKTFDDIEGMAAQRRTADEIAQALKLDPETVKYARIYLGVPSQASGMGLAQTPNPDFETWLRDYRARKISESVLGKAGAAEAPATVAPKVAAEVGSKLNISAPSSMGLTRYTRDTFHQQLDALVGGKTKASQEEVDTVKKLWDARAETAVATGLVKSTDEYFGTRLAGVLGGGTASPADLNIHYQTGVEQGFKDLLEKAMPVSKFGSVVKSIETGDYWVAPNGEILKLRRPATHVDVAKSVATTLGKYRFGNSTDAFLSTLDTGMVRVVGGAREITLDLAPKGISNAIDLISGLDSRFDNAGFFVQVIGAGKKEVQGRQAILDWLDSKSGLYQGARGSMQFLEDGRALIKAFKSADVSTLVHESAHVWRRDIAGADLATLEKWAGVKDGVWDKAHEEKFAYGFERYLSDGKAPTPELQGIFEQFKRWIINIYKQLKGTPLENEIPADVRSVYDRLLAEAPKETIAPPKPTAAVSKPPVTIEPKPVVAPAPKYTGFYKPTQPEEYVSAAAAATPQAQPVVGDALRAAIQDLKDISKERPGSSGMDAVEKMKAQYGVVPTVIDQMMPNLQKLYDASAHYGGGSPEFTVLRDALKRWFNDVTPDPKTGVPTGLKAGMQDARIAATRIGDWYVQRNILNYSARTNFDDWLSWFMPFAYWPRATATNYLMEALNRPMLITNYVRAHQALYDLQQNEGFPKRFQGAIPVPMPFASMVPWLGGNLFFDPMRNLLPIDQFLQQPFKTLGYMQPNNTDIANEIRNQVTSGAISAADGEKALKQGAGNAIWDRVSGVLSQQAEPNPLDIGSLFFSLHFPLDWLNKAFLQGKPQDISYLLPLSRQIKGGTALLKELFPTMGQNIPAGGVDPEGALRQKLGLPQGDPSLDYHIDRMLASMSLDGSITPAQARVAMLERKGPAFDAAVQRVGVESGIGSVSPLLFFNSRAMAGGETIAMQDAKNVSALVATLAKQAGLPDTASYDEVKAKLKATSGADGKPLWDQVSNWYATHPEYKPRMDLFDSTEARLSSWLNDEIWTKYLGLSALDRRMFRQQNPDFDQTFANKETRQPVANIPNSTLEKWATMLRGYVPQVAGTQQAAPTPNDQLLALLLGTGKPEQYAPQDPKLAAKYQSWLTQLSKVQDTPEYKDYQTRLAAVKQWQDAYFAPGANKKEITAAHPELVAYWDWARDFKANNPVVKDFFAFDTQFWKDNPELQKLLYGSVMQTSSGGGYVGVSTGYYPRSGPAYVAKPYTPYTRYSNYTTSSANQWDSFSASMSQSDPELLSWIEAYLQMPGGDALTFANTHPRLKSWILANGTLINVLRAGFLSRLASQPNYGYGNTPGHVRVKTVAPLKTTTNQR